MDGWKDGDSKSYLSHQMSFRQCSVGEKYGRVRGRKEGREAREEREEREEKGAGGRWKRVPAGEKENEKHKKEK
jgi:hypothetical protein